MAEKNNTAGISTPIIGDEVDKYYLNKLWLTDVKDVTRSGAALNPFSGSSTGGGTDPYFPPPGSGKRPQLDDIQKPIKQEIYYENGIAKVRVSMRIYISADDPVKKFLVKSTLPVSAGGSV